MSHTTAPVTDQGRDSDIGRRLTALTMGIDRMERRTSGGQGALDSEGLVPIYLGDDLVPPEEPENHDEALARLTELEREVASFPEGPRRTFLTAMIDSVRAAVQLFKGEELGFAEKLERLVRVPAAPVMPERLGELRDEVSGLLESRGYRNGALPDLARRWEADRFLAKDAIPAEFERLMGEAQRRTDALVFATGDYTMRLNPVSGVPYTARCNFKAGKMDLNLDLEFTRPAIKHLVCHEVFPGHSTQLLYTLEAAREGTSPPDVLLCTANGATGAVQEGIGDQGIHVIDFVEDEDDALHLALRRLRTAAATSAAWYQMAEGWPLERVHAFLEETAFPQAAWLEGRLRFAAHPFRGPFIASYWFGDEAVREVRLSAGEARRQEFVDFLYGSMNTPDSLRMFGA
ncbi:MAG TPA: hypothetical protein VNT60_07425 [Deinococcales bacterium]|nr:hypothetical protein [Deinococcales bacterium]